ncbi:unnamed protein product [Owenia fusiformis]|uniref:Uncharacterized protein n=1 Tax=Owenia fusiformis TaxID=6347 RepID=A0A8J1TYY7_OWEFU|nr:unnamed protein product [Owenia fusiformis]
MNDLNQVTKDAEKKFPHYGEYARCQSKAQMTGVVSFVVAGATAVILQEFGNQHIKTFFKSQWTIPPKARIVAPMLFGAAVAYYVTMKQSKNCQYMWMAMEGKHTALSNINGNGIGENNKQSV